MRKKRRSFLYWLSLLFYGLVLSMVLLYVRFPAAQAEHYLGKKISGLIHGATIDIGNCGYAFPAELRCDRLAVGAREEKEEMVVVENMTISPVPSGFGLKYRMVGEIAGGTFRSVAGFSPLGGIVKLNGLELTGIDLGRLAFIKNGLQRDIRGLLDFRGGLVASLRGAGLVEQEGKLTVREGDFALRQQILLADRMQMAPMDVQVSYEDGVLRLTDGSLQGGQLVVAFAGELKVSDAMANWEMTLAGSMTPAREYMAANPQVQRVVKRLQRQFNSNSLPYKVSGSFGVPRFRFGSQ